MDVTHSNVEYNVQMTAKLLTLMTVLVVSGACNKTENATSSASAEKGEKKAEANLSPDSATDTPGLVNGAFEADGDGIPSWGLKVGATQHGGGAKSTVRIITSDDSARNRVVEMRGDDSTRTWQMLSQTVKFSVSRPQVVLTFWHRAVGLKRTPGQFVNANAVLDFVDGSGKRLAIKGTIPLLGSTDWEPGRLRVAAPPGTKAVHVGALSSLTGAYQLDDLNLAVRDLTPWSKARAGEAWDFLTAEVVATYPFEPLATGIKTFEQRAGKLRPLAVGAADRVAFVDAIKKLMSPLQDHHVSIMTDGKIAIGTTPPMGPDSKTWNFDILKPMVAEALMKQGQFAVVRLKNGLGYVLIGSWQQQSQAGTFPFDAMVAAIDKLKDAPGIVIDVRTNHGGNEALAQRIAGRFAAKPIVYAKHRYRLGDGYGPWKERTLQPSTKTPYAGKVAVLQSRWSMSSNEGFLLMMRALANATTIGTPTRGSSSDPAQIAVTGDVSVISSRWQAALPDGTFTEHKGVPPEIPVTDGVAAYASDDPMLRKAFELLLAK